MSGGHFDYVQYRIHDIVRSIDEILESDSSEYDYVRGFSPETIAKMREAMYYLEVAEEYAQRIDWLVSADDSEKCFHERLEKNLKQIKEKYDKN